jgi:N-dimethylarginine dimethylaminohydrolase
VLFFACTGAAPIGLCPLSEKAAPYLPSAFDVYARRALENQIPDLIPVPAQEAERFACNAIVAGKNVVMNSGCPVARGKIEELGFNIFETALDEFLEAGGRAKRACRNSLFPKNLPLKTKEFLCRNF